MSPAGEFSAAIRILAWVLIALTSPGCSTWKAAESPLHPASISASAPSRLRVVLRNYEAFTVHDPRVARDSLFGMPEVTLELQPGQT